MIVMMMMMMISDYLVLQLSGNRRCFYPIKNGQRSIRRQKQMKNPHRKATINSLVRTHKTRFQTSLHIYRTKTMTYRSRSKRHTKTERKTVSIIFVFVLQQQQHQCAMRFYKFQKSRKTVSPSAQITFHRFSTLTRAQTCGLFRHYFEMAKIILIGNP